MNTTWRSHNQNRTQILQLKYPFHPKRVTQPRSASRGIKKFFRGCQNVLNRSSFSTKTTRILLPILVSLVSFLAYLNTLHHQFVFDDFRVITNNPYIKDWKYFPTLFNHDYFKISGELSYRPLVTLSYFIDYAIWHLNPFGFHLTNLIIHTLNTFIVYLLLFKITRRFNLTVI